MMTRALEILKIPSQVQKLWANEILTLIGSAIADLIQQNLVQKGNGSNFWSREGIFKKSSPVFLIWPGEHNVLSQIAYFQL